MGSLSNLYISQSYISLIHLGSNNTASSTPTELQDGLGNGVGVSVSTNGNLYVSGNVYATNLTGSGGSINTGSLVTTSSFNAYTSSNDSKVNSLIAATASYVTSAITASSLITASVSQSTITFTKGDGSQFNIVVADVSGSAGDFVTTASFNAYTASQDFKNTTFATTSSVTDLSSSLYFTDTTQSNNIASNSSSIGLLQTFSGSQYKNDSSSFDSRILAITSSGGNVSVQDEGSILGNATSFNFIGAGVTTALSAGTASVTIPGGGGSINTGSFATTGSNTFTGDQTILGSIVSNPTTSLTELFSQAFVSGAVQYNITASNATSQSNLVLGGTPLLFSQTGSVIVSGSNNIFLSAARNNTLATNFSNGYIGGNNNIVLTIPTLHTQSLVNPTITNNTLNSILALNFITSSTLAVPVISNNQILGGTTITHTSGSVSFQGNIVMGNGLQSTANITPLTLNSTIAQNVVAGLNSIVLNHNSSSITYNGNIGGGMTVTNNYSSSVSTAVNNISVQANTFAGTGHTLLVSGSNTANRRTFNSNIIVGSTNAISSDLIGSTGGHLIATAVIGQNLIVSASGTSITAGGGAFFGRYNDINAGLADSGKTIFAVGTGTSTSNRRTSLSIDSSSVVNISGSLTITGSNLNIDGSGNITASTFLATNNGSTAFIYNQQSTGSVAGVWNTNYGKDGLSVYQYQGQPYAFNVLLTANQIAAYTGSEFQWGLQTNGTLALPGGGSTYFAMSSGSTITGSGGGANKVGLDYLETAMIMDFKADTAFNRKVYVDKGMYVSQSVGGGKPALIVNGTNAASSKAIVATGSVDITGSLSVSNTASFNAPVVINNNSDLYLYGHKQFNVGAFQSNITQSGSAAVSQSMQFETTDLSYGVTMVSNSRITLANAGIYNIQFSTQLLADTGADNVWIWLKKNGTNLQATAGHVVLANNDELITSWNYVIDAAANDYYELVWQSAGGDAVLFSEAATGNIPSIPSVILTVTQVR